MKGKTRKSIIKRFKITKSGKIFRRVSGQDHYRTKLSGKKRRARRAWVEVSKADRKKLREYMYFKH